ncbi:hypothetical protein B0O99DRAFT_701021 [Bisporella sp. PMI_857]|nr:hypothetical protein B0O99DRAFT_701021 [Bisporella sp. PMI_857]
MLSKTQRYRSFSFARLCFASRIELQHQPVDTAPEVPEPLLATPAKHFERHASTRTLTPIARLPNTMIVRQETDVPISITTSTETLSNGEILIIAANLATVTTNFFEATHTQLPGKPIPTISRGPASRLARPTNGFPIDLDSFITGCEDLNLSPNDHRQPAHAIMGGQKPGVIRDDQASARPSLTASVETQGSQYHTLFFSLPVIRPTVEVERRQGIASREATRESASFTRGVNDTPPRPASRPFSETYSTSKKRTDFTKKVASPTATFTSLFDDTPPYHHHHRHHCRRHHRHAQRPESTYLISGKAMADNGGLHAHSLYLPNPLTNFTSDATTIPGRKGEPTTLATCTRNEASHLIH